VARPGRRRKELPLVEHRNEVVLAGRLKDVAKLKVLPSGDEIVTWRLIVARPRPLATRQSTDWVDCVAFGARVRRAALGWQIDDVIEVNGALRRRFWRGAGGLTNRCEIDVSGAANLTTAGRGTARSTTAGPKKRSAAATARRSVVGKRTDE
jgi:single-strand DNA-binding protein